MHNFSPAAENEKFVFGAKRPGYGSENVPRDIVAEWIDAMKTHGIQRVCCLLNDEHLDYYDDLLSEYRQAFGAENVCHAPVEDFHLADEMELKETIFPFLDESEEQEMPVVVHCSAGSGRTGHVLAAWLVHKHGWDAKTAIAAVKDAAAQYGAARNPYEAGDGVDALLERCRK